MNCTNCSIGTYQSLTGQAFCVDCQAGTFCKYNPLINVKNERINVYLVDLSVTGCVNCSHCEPGFYTNETRQSKCDSCPIGTYQPGFGSTTCLDCPPGFQSLYMS